MQIAIIVPARVIREALQKGQRSLTQSIYLLRIFFV